MAEPISAPVSHQQPFAVEICCGQASLPRSLLNDGFAVLAVDHLISDPQAPVTLLDLTDAGHQEILLDILNHHPPDYIHLGTPCGTASRAREKPVSDTQRKLGAPNPIPLRSATHPLENPHRSWFWAAILAIILEAKDPKLTKFWDSLQDVFFHNCCHGGQRKKGTRWKSSPGVFDALSATCQNDHEHLPFQVNRIDGQWAFDTAAEAAYPSVLTKKVASLVKKLLEAQGRVFVPRPLPRIQTLAAQHRQHKKRDQLIPEFFTIQSTPVTQNLTSFQKLLPSFSKGESPEEGFIDGESHEEGFFGRQRETTNQQTSKGHHMVGTWHTPEQFVLKAKNITHPMDENAPEKITLDALDTVINMDPRLLAIERKKNLLKAKIKQKQVQREEADLHANLPASVERVVHDKSIILWRSLLQEYGYDDMEVVDFMTRGVPLVGTHNHPSCYAVKIKPATLTESELRDSALFCRQALMSRKPQTDEPGFAEHFEETAAEEVPLGFLEGPSTRREKFPVSWDTTSGESCEGL